MTHSILLAAVAVTALGQTLVFTLLPSLGRAAGLAEIQVGLIISCSALLFALASPVWGAMSDSLGRRRVLIIGLSGYAAGTLLFTLVFDAGMRGVLGGALLVSALVLSRCLQASIMAATPAAAAAYTADITTIYHRTRGMSRISAANSLGTIIGPVTGGVLAAVALVFPLYLVAAVTASMLLWVIIALPPSPQVLQPRTVSIPQVIKRSLAGYGDPRFRDLLAAGVAFFLCFALIQQTLGFLYQDYFAMSPTDAARALGVTMMVAALTSLSAQLLVVNLLRAPARLLLIMAIPAMFISALLLWQGESRMAINLAVVFMGVSLGFAMPAVMSLASLRVGPEEQGKVAGLASACPALGFILGPLLGTGLYTLGPRLPYLLVVLLMVPLAVLVWTRVVKGSS